MQDSLRRFLFNNLDVRGEYVSLNSAWKEILSRREYPENVQNLLGELVAATALLGATIKMDGKLTIQIQSSGDVSLMVAQLTNTGGIRALAKHIESPKGHDLKSLCGTGQLIITLESKGSNTPYQGVIPLIDNSIKLALERYFETSEQLPTRLELASDKNTVAGLFLQRLPGSNNISPADNDDAFNRITHLSATITSEELLKQPLETLLTNVFNEDDIQIFPATPINFECSCSRTRTFNMLSQFSETEVTEMLQENNGKISVECQFCGKNHQFDEIDIKASGNEPLPTTH